MSFDGLLDLSGGDSCCIVEGCKEPLGLRLRRELDPPPSWIRARGVLDGDSLNQGGGCCGREKGVGVLCAAAVGWRAYRQGVLGQGGLASSVKGSLGSLLWRASSDSSKKRSIR